jgi:hypothetical protein
MGNGRTARIPRETHKPTPVVAEFVQIAPKRLRVHRLAAITLSHQARQLNNIVP